MSDGEAWLKTYQEGGFQDIQGWLVPGSLELLGAVDDAQEKMSVTGGVMEIGIFQGRFFIAMNGLVRDAATQSMAIDVFGDQHLNIDSSGAGNEVVFRENLERYDRHKGANVVIMRADSTTLRPDDVLGRLNARPRIISVDGGHTPEHTINDIELARSVLAPQGIVFVDDILNHHWPGVVEGVVTYLKTGSTLWPVTIGYNKLLLAPMSIHGRYRDELSARMKFTKSVRFCGYEVLAV